MITVKRAVALGILLWTMLSLCARPVGVLPPHVQGGTEVPEEVRAALDGAFWEALEASQIAVAKPSTEYPALGMTINHYAAVSRGEAVLVTCLLTITWKPPDAEVQEFPVELRGLGAAEEYAAADAAGYFRRLLPLLLRDAEGLYPPDHLARVSGSGVFLYSSDPVYRGGGEFAVLDRSQEISGVLRVRSLRYWGKEADDEDLWPHYLPVDVLYSTIALQEGIGVRPLDTLGISLTIQGGTGIETWRTGESFMNPLLTLEAFPRKWGDTASPLLTAGIQGLWNTDEGFTLQRFTLQAGWVMTLLPFRGAGSQSTGVLSRTLVQPSAAFGWGLDAQWGHLIAGKAGIRAQVLASVQTALGVFGDVYMLFPLSSEDWKLEGMGWNAGISVTYRL